MEKNTIDLAHCNFLIQIMELLEHNDFLTSQSNRIKELYKYMTVQYPYLAFTFKGRIKSLIRAEEKFNGYIVEYIHDYYLKNQKFPTELEIKNGLQCFRDLIAYCIVISLPKCHLEVGENRTESELRLLYEIANMLPEFLEERGFTAELSGTDPVNCSEQLHTEVRPYYRDYIQKVRPHGYQSLHITLYDNIARCYTEVQLRTKDMDDHAEIGAANHFGYEKQQETDRARREVIDGCGLFRGRQILPFEHLSSYQNDLID